MKKKKEQKKRLDYGKVRKEKREKMMKMEGEKRRRWVASQQWIFGVDRSSIFPTAVRSGGEQKRKKEKERKRKREGKKWKM